MTALKVAVAGAGGRMGARVAHAVEAADDLALVATPPRGALDGDWNGAQALAEFTAPEATARLADLAAERGVGLVVGTTGLDATAVAAVDRAAARVPVLVAPNLSLGVAALEAALKAALAALPGYDVEIVERHHGGKVDAPSGTALALARTVTAARGWPFPGALRKGRDGKVGERPRAEVGIHSLRGGAWIGEHTVVLTGPFETLELTHEAHDRAAFAGGALLALRFVAHASPGRYGLADALAEGAARGG
jgi:4-hydroxy-tetrahydrodipicolinate reductase